MKKNHFCMRLDLHNREITTPACALMHAILAEVHSEGMINSLSICWSDHCASSAWLCRCQTCVRINVGPSWRRDLTHSGEAVRPSCWNRAMKFVCARIRVSLRKGSIGGVLYCCVNATADVSDVQKHHWLQWDTASKAVVMVSHFSFFCFVSLMWQIKGFYTSGS